ncbi:hypothetical protein [Achromobacter sp. UMC71]|nr:hypothetical protein [Achromobacter sp. UMC71]
MLAGLAGGAHYELYLRVAFVVNRYYVDSIIEGGRGSARPPQGNPDP